jgi:hypothetical protein
MWHQEQPLHQPQPARQHRVTRAFDPHRVYARGCAVHVLGHGSSVRRLDGPEQVRRTRLVGVEGPLVAPRSLPAGSVWQPCPVSPEWPHDRWNACTAMGSVMKTRSSPTTSRSPAVRRSACSSCLNRASASTTPRRASSPCSAASPSAAVLSISTFASALSRNHRGGPAQRPARSQRPAAEVPGVGEAQRRVVAVYEQAGHRSGVRVVVDVVHPGHPGHVAQHAVVRAGQPVQ